MKLADFQANAAASEARFGKFAKLNRHTSLSALAVLLLVNSAPAYAQGAPADEDDSEIIVTGIKESLANAQRIKKDADTVVEAITAEDIGALPDRSVTEALQRVPGVAINRFAGSNDPDHFSVEGSGVVIRGLNFVRSEFNGRDAFVAGVGGQALNFSDVPSELLGSVIVAKNQTAEMLEGGLAGTVNLNTRKPFDNPDFKIAFSAEGNYGDFQKKWTPTLSGLISKTWDTGAGRFGLLGSVSYSRIKSRADGFQITNFQTRDGSYVSQAFAGTNQICRTQLPTSTDTQGFLPGLACGGTAPAGANGFADLAGVRYAPLGGQFRTQDFDRKRLGFNFSGQYESESGDTLLTAEFIRSNTTNKWNERTFETGPDLSEYNTFPRGCQQNTNGPLVLNGPNGVQAANTGPSPRAECPNGFTNYLYDDTGLFQQGYIVQAGGGWRGNNPLVPIGGLQQTLARRLVDEETTNQDWGVHLRQKLTEKLTLDLDAQYATSRKQNTDLTIHGSTFADQELDLRGDLPIATPHRPTFTSYPWGGDAGTAVAGLTDAQYFSDPRFTFFRSAMDHIEDSSGHQYAFKGDLNYDIGEDSFIRKVKLGARYSDRDQTVRYTTYNWGMLSEVWSGPRPVNFTDVPAANREFYTFPNFFRGKVATPVGGFFYNADGVNSYEDWLKITDDLKARQAALGGFSTFNALGDRGGAIAGTPFLRGDIQPIKQQDSSAYAMISFGTDEAIAGIRISGNVGLRYANTNLRSEGFPEAPTQGGLGIGQSYNDRCPIRTNLTGTSSRGGGVCNLTETEYVALQQFSNGAGQFVADRKKYSNWLPSFNLKLGIGDDVVVRFAGSKVMTRPLNDYVRNYFVYSIDGGGNLTAQAGNPNLDPATAWQFDATAEWYFDRVGSVTASLFYKDIKNFFFQNVQSRTVTNNGQTRNILVRVPDNFRENGKVKGFELAYQQTYDFLPGFLNGLGFSGNYTYIKSKGLPNSFLNAGGTINPSTISPSGNLPLEQLSKHNINATLFYEKGPVSLRAAYNWRSRFLLTASDVIFPFYSIFNEATGQLDASAFFSVTKNIKIGVQGVNLLNEVTRTSQAYTGDPALLAPRSYFVNDRRFSFVLRGNF